MGRLAAARGHTRAHTDGADGRGGVDAAALSVLGDVHARTSNSYASDRMAGDASTALVLPSRKRARPSDQPKQKERPAPVTREQKRAEKSAERRTRKALEEKDKKARRKFLYDVLERTALDENELALLLPSGALGQRMTARAAADRAQAEERAGIHTGLVRLEGETAGKQQQDTSDEDEAEREEQVDEHDGLVGEEDDEDEEEEGEEGEEDDDDDDEEEEAGIEPRKRVRWARSASDANGHDDNDDDSDIDGSSPQDMDDDDDDDADENDDDEDATEDDEESDDDGDIDDEEDSDAYQEVPQKGSRTASRSKRSAATTTNSGNAATSAFAFTVRIPSAGSAAAVSSATAPVSTSAVSATPAAGAAVPPSSLPQSGRHKQDAAMMKLLQLRERNTASAATDAKIQVDEMHTDESQPGAAPAGRSIHPAPAAQRLASLPADASAADALRLLDAADRRSNDVTDDYFAALLGEARKADSLAAADEQEDEHMLRAALWSADSTTVLRHKTSLPDSAYSAYRFGSVRIARDPAIVETRNALPVVGMETEIMEAIHDNDIVLICGETGSGKTTQVPQFLYEAGFSCPRTELEPLTYEDAATAEADVSRPRPFFRGIPGLIGVTQPRRVAATAMAARVAQEMATTVGGSGHLGYQIRYDTGTVSASTRVKFMTDGVLLREIQQDILLRKYSVIIIDEAHERNINTDLLIGLLSRALPLRNRLAKQQAEACRRAGGVKSSDALPLAPLKLLIMSATLRVDDFAKNPRLFDPAPPVVRVQARRFPVTVHFAKRTELVDYVGEAYSKSVKIHTRLPDGGILVFVTGADEVEHLVKRLRNRFATADTSRRKAQVASVTAAEVAEDGNQSSEEEPKPVVVLPLYALLPPTAQRRVFEPVPEGHRLIVVATNVAETSLTIPGIRYVVDAGRVKRRVYDLNSGTSRFEVGWISQASADQRAGRAGRTGPGHCYRLYSSAVFMAEFAKFEEPELLRMPLENVLLSMKSMGIHSPSAFPFPTPPEPSALRAALSVLRDLGAVDTSKPGKETLTSLGAALARIPLHPSLGKMLVLAAMQHATDPALLDFMVAAASCLTVQEPFMRPPRAPRLTSAQDSADKRREADTDDAASVDSELDDGPTNLKEAKLAAELDSEDAAPTPAADDATDADDAAAKLRNAAAAAIAQFRHPLSDALTVLRAAGAYAHVLQTEGGDAASKFCRANSLRVKAMKEISQLRRQLHDIVCLHVLPSPDTSNRDDATLASGDAGEAFDSGVNAARKRRPPFQLALSPPDAASEARIRQLLCAGLLHRVARRAPPEQVPSLCAAAHIGMGRRWMPYVAATTSVTDTLWTHPRSAVFDSDGAVMPAYVVFHEVVQGKRAYMRGVTAIDAEWLHTLASGTPLCKYGPVLETPNPRYDAGLDCVVAWSVPNFGERTWALPAAMIPYPASQPDAGDTVLRTFARSLLEGLVVPALRAYKNAWIAPPAVILKGLPHKRILLLLEALRTPPKARESPAPDAPWIQGPVVTAAKLALIWLQCRDYLRIEIRAWLKPELCDRFDAAWPGVVKLALAQWVQAGLLRV